MSCVMRETRTARQGLVLSALNAELRALGARARVERAAEFLPGPQILSSSFGAQAAVSLHLVTQALPGIPVVLIDTGYLFAETYRFADQLAARLRLNLKVYGPAESPAWLEARHGKLWEQGAAGIERYNQVHKVEPMQRALAELGAGTWFAGLRRQQSGTRAAIEPVQRIGSGRFKVHPIFDWTDRDVHEYLRRNDLPYHPLWERGYVSIGDWHTTRSLREAGDDAGGTRFFGVQRECGLHLIGAGAGR
ncbi:MAG: phosphoadenylyl-sulfate reductase [Gammaproteobacteria bacterium]|nr:phosphoadenylyl-sulfate reductase [Gammaproteobacteria bacterium]